MFFGRTKPQGSSALILDIENGSVGAALVNDTGGSPRLFGETRIHLPLLQTRDSTALATSIERGVRDALKEVSLVAARLRNYEQTHEMGSIGHANIFLSAPWGTPNLENNRPQFIAGMRDYVRAEVQAFVGDAPVSFFTSADTAVYGLNRIAPHDEALVVMVRGEIAEIVLLNDGVAGFATIPHGHHLLIRTIKTHAGVSHAEARSALELGQHAAYLHEPLASAGEYFAQEFADIAHQLVVLAPAHRVVVIAEGKAGSMFAQALARSPHLLDVFPQGGEVRSLAAHQVAPYIASHKNPGDLFLLLDALFTQAKAV